jgi:hypothetical protein
MQASRDVVVIPIKNDTLTSSGRRGTCNCPIVIPLQTDILTTTCSICYAFRVVLIPI